jgi:hypothetical protein
MGDELEKIGIARWDSGIVSLVVARVGRLGTDSIDKIGDHPMQTIAVCKHPGVTNPAARSEHVVGLGRPIEGAEQIARSLALGGGPTPPQVDRTWERVNGVDGLAMLGKQ